MHEVDLLANIGLCIVTATFFGIIAKALRQPLLLAYIAAGIALGSHIGFGWIQDQETIHTISELGLILLLFIIGLEIDLKKLISSGWALAVSGLSQFIICSGLGIGFALFLGLNLGNGKFDAVYLAVAMALSSTMIVVKLLYDKFELSTLPGRITLGILVFQDIWAILFLAVQPNLLNPQVSSLLLSFIQGAGLVILSLIASRYILPRVFAFIAKVPELLLVTAIAWCFLISGIAGSIGLSREMGALIAGVSLSTFPYNVDVIAKVINIRDFFVTLFFIGLGLQIPKPTQDLLIYAGIASTFLVISRFISIFPILHIMKNGLRTSLIPSINLCQMSEFSLVIASLGLALGHINTQTMGILTFIFVATSILSTYMINYNHQIQEGLTAVLKRIGLKDLGGQSPDQDPHDDYKSVVFLGFFNEASSILHEMENTPRGSGGSFQDDVLVVDFNPIVHEQLKLHGIKCLYGDIASLDTLHHAHISSAKLVVSSIPDSILRGTSNERLMRMAKRLCPQSEFMATSNTIAGALALYEQGAEFVFIPRIHSAKHIAKIITNALDQGLAPFGKIEFEELKNRKEILP